MPGSSLYDFGDSIRTGACTAAEDEPDAERVDFRADMFRAYAEGFVEGTAGALTDREIAMLPDGAYIITLEQAIRFLTDYLEGDVYYHTAYADHNLVRTRTQIRMLHGDLGAGANQIMVGIRGVVVNIALQVIRQEADRLLQRNDVRPVRKHCDLPIGQRPGSPLYKALRVGAEHICAEIHAFRIRLVLRRRAGARADGITEIVQRGAGHDGIQIYHADERPGRLIQQDIRQFGVVVRDTERDAVRRQGRPR